MVTVAVGPAAAICAATVVGMDAIEATAVLFLISAWIGPLLIARGE